MGRIVFHAGMPKAGSSSVQRWLERRAVDLREQHGVDVVTARTAERRTKRGAQHVAVLAYPECGGGVNAGDFVKAHAGNRGDDSAVRSLFEQLDERARQHATTLITSEALTQLF